MEIQTKVRNRLSVTCYKSTDGKLFEDKKEFLAYQKGLDIKQNLDLFFREISIKSSEDAIDFIIMNKELFLNILLNKEKK